MVPPKLNFSFTPVAFSTICSSGSTSFKSLVASTVKTLASTVTALATLGLGVGGVGSFWQPSKLKARAVNAMDANFVKFFMRAKAFAGLLTTYCPISRVMTSIISAMISKLGGSITWVMRSSTARPAALVLCTK